MPLGLSAGPGEHDALGARVVGLRVAVGVPGGERDREGGPGRPRCRCRDREVVESAWCDRDRDGVRGVAATLVDGDVRGTGPVHAHGAVRAAGDGGYTGREADRSGASEVYGYAAGVRNGRVVGADGARTREGQVVRARVGRGCVAVSIESGDRQVVVLAGGRGGRRGRQAETADGGCAHGDGHRVALVGAIAAPHGDVRRLDCIQAHHAIGGPIDLSDTVREGDHGVVGRAVAEGDGGTCVVGHRRRVSAGGAVGALEAKRVVAGVGDRVTVGIADDDRQVVGGAGHRSRAGGQDHEAGRGTPVPLTLKGLVEPLLPVGTSVAVRVVACRRIERRRSGIVEGHAHRRRELRSRR